MSFAQCKQITASSLLAICCLATSAAIAQNVIPNGNFAHGAVPLRTPVSLASIGSGVGPSAATDWTLYNNYTGTTTSTLVDARAVLSPEPFAGGSGNVFHIVTDTGGQGFEQFGAPAENNISTWIFLNSGEATLDEITYQPNAPVYTQFTDSTVGRWINLGGVVSTPGLLQEIAIESGDKNGNGGPADFYVGLVQSNGVASPVPEFGTVYSLGALLAAGGAGLWLRRLQRRG